MDFNEISARIERMRRAVDATDDATVERHARQVVEDIPGQPNHFRISIDFAGAGEADAQATLLGAVAAIASLKDHLKRNLRESGGNPQAVENAIDASPAWCLCMDLWNLDKHGAPLSRPPRSGFEPALANIARAMSISGGSTVYMPLDCSEIMATAPVRIVIHGEVLKPDDSVVCTVETMMTDAVRAVETFMENHPAIRFSRSTST